MSTLPEVRVREKQKVRTYIIYLLTYLLDGIQTSIIAASLWIYLETEIAVPDKKILYSCLCAAYGLIPTLFTITCSSCSPPDFDNVRALSMSLLFFSFIGSSLYTLFTTPYLLAFGRLLQGFTPVTCLIITKEIAKSYSQEELYEKLPMTSLFCLIGYIVGPLFALALTKAKWNPGGGIDFRYGSFCGLVLAIATFLMFMLMAFTKNFSEEYILVGEDDEDKKIVNDESSVFDSDPGSSQEEDFDQDSKAQLIKEKDGEEVSLSSNSKTIDKILLLAITFIGYMWTMMFYWAIPKILHYNLKFNVEETNYYFIAYFFILSIILFNATRLAADKDGIFWIGFTTIFSFLIAATCIFVIFKSTNSTTNLVFLCCFCLFFGYLELGEKIFLPISYRKLFYPKDHCEDNIRVVLRRVGGLIGSSTAVYWVEYYDYTFPVVFVTMTFLLLCLWVRRETFSNLKVVV